MNKSNSYVFLNPKLKSQRGGTNFESLILGTSGLLLIVTVLFLYRRDVEPMSIAPLYNAEIPTVTLPPISFNEVGPPLEEKSIYVHVLNSNDKSIPIPRSIDDFGQTKNQSQVARDANERGRSNEIQTSIENLVHLSIKYPFPYMDELNQIKIYSQGNPVPLKSPEIMLPIKGMTEIRVTAAGCENWNGLVNRKAAQNNNLVIELEPLKNPIPGNDYWLPLNSGDYISFVWIPALNVWVGRFEITNSQFKQYRPTHKSDAKGNNPVLDQREHPVLDVSFSDARNFSIWLNMTRSEELAGCRVRMPKSTEWEVYSRCGDDRTYPWGNQHTYVYGNLGDQSWVATDPYLPSIFTHDDGFPYTAPVNKCGANEWGIYGIAGNAIEWLDFGHPRNAEIRGGAYLIQRPVSNDTVWGDFPVERVLPHTGFRLVMAPSKD